MCATFGHLVLCDLVSVMLHVLHDGRVGLAEHELAGLGRRETLAALDDGLSFCYPNRN